MDHSDKSMSTVTTLENRDETNLATQSSLNVPAIPIQSGTTEVGYMRLFSLDIRCFLQPQSDHTNGWHILIHPMQAQLKRFPLCRQPDPAGLACAQRPPVPASFTLSLEQVGKSHGHVADHWVLQEVPIVDDLDCDYGGLLISTQEFRGRLPHGGVRVFEALGSVGWRGLITQVDLDQWVEVT